MDDLVAFLRARLDEDEEVAQLAESVDPSPWYEDVEDGSYTNQREGLDGVGLVRAADNVGLWDREQSCTLSMAAVSATHAARHDPARVLREVEAKRRVLARHQTDPKAANDRLFARACQGCGVMGDCDDPVTEDINDCPELRDIATVYADHPSYREEWRP